MPEIAAIRSRNLACNKNLVPLCRMMRKWRDHCNVPIGGLLIDTLAYNFIGDWEHREKSYFFYDLMCRDFLKYLSDQSHDKTYWRAPGSSQYVYRKGIFQYKATQAFNTACEAIGHETATPTRTWSAKQRWRDIFGTSFPS